MSSQLNKAYRFWPMVRGLFGLNLSIIVIFLGALSSALSQTPPEKLVGHGGPIRAIELSHDGQTALTGSFDYAINHWALEGKNGKIINRLIGHNAAVNDVAFVGDQRAVSVGDDGAFIIWDLISGNVLKKFVELNDKILDVAVSKDQKWAASARWDGVIHLYDLTAMKLVKRFKGHRGNVNAVTFALDSQSVFSASYDGTIRQWTIVLDEGVKDNEPRLIYKHGWGINVIKLIANDQLIFGGLDGSLVHLDLTASIQSKQVLKINRPILSLAVHSDIPHFAMGGGDGFIHVFDKKALNEIDAVQVSYGPVWAMAFDNGGDGIYHGGLDDFVSLRQINPKKAYDPIKDKYPRRFQVSTTGNPDVAEGELQFKRKCSVCHTLQKNDGNRAGPSLYNLFGRRAGTLKDYPYSKALLTSKIIWDAKTLSQLFDEGPDVVTPGTKMPIQRLKSVEKREELINYLKHATAPK